MAPVNLRSLIAHLGDTGRQAMESAAGLCLSQTHYNVEIEHWLLKLLEDSSSDIPQILRHFEVDPSRLQADVIRSMERLKTGKQNS